MMATPRSVGAGAALILCAFALSPTAFAAGEAPKSADAPTRGAPLVSISHATPAGATMLVPLSGRPAPFATPSPVQVKRPDFSSSGPADPAAMTAAQRAKQAALESAAPLAAPAFAEGKSADVVTILPGDASARAAAVPHAKSAPTSGENARSFFSTLGTLPRAEWSGLVLPKWASFGTAGPSLTGSGAAMQAPFRIAQPARETKPSAAPRPPEVTTSKPLDPAANPHRKEVRP